MKHVLLLSFLSMGILPVNSQMADDVSNFVTTESLSVSSAAGTPGQADAEKMPAVIFRAQEVCRAELKDFEFDVHYKVVSATVYFSGTNFRMVETGYITSNSLKPIRNLMDRCAAGTMVVFDNVKVQGPDHVIRPIQGNSYLLK